MNRSVCSVGEYRLLIRPGRVVFAASLPQATKATLTPNPSPDPHPSLYLFLFDPPSASPGWHILPISLMMAMANATELWVAAAPFPSASPSFPLGRRAAGSPPPSDSRLIRSDARRASRRAEADRPGPPWGWGWD